jgi:hypothetical protein
MNNCYYTVIRYVPNPIAEEFVNIAVVVFTEEQADCRIKYLDHALAFGSYNDEEMLKEFCDRLSNGCKNNDLSCIEAPNSVNRIHAIRMTSNNWQNSIQLREPCGSLGAISEAIDAIAKDFLGEKYE